MQTPEFLLFTKKERSIIIFLFTVILCFYGYIFFTKPKPDSISKNNLSEVLELRKNVPDSIEQIIERVSNLKKKPKPKSKTSQTNRFKTSKHKAYKKTEIKFQEFDPNQIDSLTWIELGFSPFSTKATLNYRAKGGVFRSCEGLYKVYGMDSSHVAQLIPYCIIDQSNLPKPKYNKNYKPKAERIIVDINTADTTALKTLKGVGSKYATTIINYRDAIGGFREIQELTKVYGIEQSVIDDNIDYLTISPLDNLININTASVKELNKLYAINYKQSQIIVNYRSHHGPFRSLEDIKLTKVVSDSAYAKMLPYITID